MITWGLLIVASFPVMYFLVGRYGRQNDRFISEVRLLFSLLLAFTVGSIATVPASIVITGNAAKTVAVRKVELKNLSDYISSQGTFFLATGGVGPKSYYHFMPVDADGGSTVQDWAANDNIRTFEDGKKPELWYIDDAYRDPRVYWFTICAPGPETRYEFHVPKGTVYRGVSLQ